MVKSNKFLFRLKCVAFAFASIFILAGTAQAGSLSLAWDPNTEPDIAGYVVYYGTVSGTYTNTFDVGNTTTWTGNSLTDGQRYFFIVCAYNTSGLYSPASAEVSGVVPLPGSGASIVAPVPGVALGASATTFSWTAGTAVSNYRLSVGTTVGGTNLFDQTTTGLSATVTLPVGTGTAYVRLWSYYGSTWHFTDYTYVRGTAALSIGNVSVTEGNSGTKTAQFTVTLTPAAAQTVTVAYATADGTATAGSDYVAASGTLTFAPGISTQPVNVTVNGDTAVEPNETFFVNLTSPANATLAAAQGVGTIQNDDTSTSTLSVSTPAVTVVEGNSGTKLASFTVTLSPASTQTVTVAYATANGTATAGSDYVAASGTLTFAPGVTTQSIDVTVNGDTTVEPDETFLVNLTSPTNATIATAQGVGTIQNDDTALPTLAMVTTSVAFAEGNSGTKTVMFTVSLTPASAQTVTVAYATADGTATAGSDYVAASGTLTFAPGATSQQIAVTVNGDTTVEADETFVMNLTSPTNATLGAAQSVATIRNDDAPVTPTVAMATPAVRLTEGNSGTKTASFTVSLTPVSTQTVTVAYATANGTATAGTDYVGVSGTLTFAPGVTTQLINVTVNGDTTVEPDETFFVNLTSPTNATLGTAQGVGTILNDDAVVPTVAISTPAVSVTEGNSGTKGASFTVTLTPTSTQTVTVAYATADGTATAGSDYVAAIGTLTFAPGVSSQTINVTVNGDTAVEPDETFLVNLTSPTNATLGTAQGVGTIQNDDTTTAAITVTPTVVPGGTITVALANGLGLRTDWVALYPAGSNSFVAWMYLNGTQSQPATGLSNATLQFTAPMIPGSYTVRWVANGWTSPLSSASITVQKSVPTGSITVAAPTVVPGGTITVALGGGLGQRTDWVALYQAGSNNYVSWMFLNGAQSMPATGLTDASVQFQAPLDPGTYYVRWVANGWTSPLTSNPITVQPLSVSGTIVVATPTVAPGGTISAALANGLGLRTDWVGLYAAGGNSYLAWMFLNGAQTLPATGLTNAAVHFQAPMTPGTYEIRWIANGWPSPLKSSPITVQGSATTPTISVTTPTVVPGGTISVDLASGPGGRSEWVGLYPTGSAAFVAWAYLNGTTTLPATGLTSASLQLQAPPTPGTYEIRWFSNGWASPLKSSPVTVQGAGAPVITLSAATVAPGATIDLTVANGSGTPSDWVGLYPTAANDSGYAGWEYLNGSHALPATGIATAALQFIAPSTPGTYQIRWFSSGWTAPVFSSTITVAGAAAQQQ